MYASVFIALPGSQWIHVLRQLRKLFDVIFYGTLYLATCGVQVVDFLGDASGIISVCNALGRQWIHVRRQSTRLFGRFSHLSYVRWASDRLHEEVGMI